MQMIHKGNFRHALKSFQDMRNDCLKSSADSGDDVLVPTQLPRFQNRD